MLVKGGREGNRIDNGWASVPCESVAEKNLKGWASVPCESVAEKNLKPTRHAPAASDPETEHAQRLINKELLAGSFRRKIQQLANV